MLSWVDDEPPLPESEDDRRVYLLAPILIEELVRAIYRVAGASKRSAASYLLRG